MFSAAELYTKGYHRFVSDLNGLDKATFLANVEVAFATELACGSGCDNNNASESSGAEPSAQSYYGPTQRGELGMYLDGSWYRLRVHESERSDEAAKGLDVSYLQDHLIGPVLGIHDLRNDNRLGFLSGEQEVEDLAAAVDAHPGSVAFMFYPCSLAELFAVADANELMPPKSTWFTPKLRSGLFLRTT
jgi:uncharacterized protein (DUF1015 family)